MKIKLSEHFNYRKLIKFTLPSVIMMIFTNIYGAVDGIFVSNCIGGDAFASVNLIIPVLSILGTIGVMAGTGGSALISKTLGEGDTKKANRYFSMLIYSVLILGFVLTVLGIIFIKPLTKILGATENIMNDCIIYGRTLLIFLIPFMLQYCFQTFLVVAEKPTFGLIMAIVSGVMNLCLDFFLIYVFEMGVFGAALATGISQLVGGIIPLVYFIIKNKSPLRLIKTKFEWKPLKQSITNGASELVTNLSMSLMNVIFNYQLMKLVGTDGVVAYGIIIYISSVFLGTYMGYGIGSAPIVSYHYGAKNDEEIKNIFKRSLKLIITTSIVVTLIAEISAKPLAQIFVSADDKLLEFSINAIRIFSLSYLISGFNIYASSFFTALNDGLVSATISLSRTFLFQLIMVFILPLILGINGIWLSIFIAEVLSLIVSIACFIKFKKKYKYI